MNKTPLLDLLASKVIPQLQNQGMDCVVVARPTLAQVKLPPGVTASRREVRGRRIAYKGPRTYSNLSYITARWPDDGLQTMWIPNLTCVVGGRADLRCGQYSLGCDAGYIMWATPGTPVSDGSRPHLEGEQLQNGWCDTLGIATRGRGIQLWLGRSWGTAYHGTTYQSGRANENAFVPNAEAVHLLNHIDQEITAEREGWEEICGPLLLALFRLLRRELDDGHYLLMSGGWSEEPVRPLDHDPIALAQSYIKAHLNDALTIERVAQNVHLSRAQFSRLFRAQTGCTFLEWTNARRLEEACNFLRETDWSIPLISGFVGFKSASHFHQLFRSAMQVTPQEYRCRSRSQSNLTHPPVDHKKDTIPQR